MPQCFRLVSKETGEVASLIKVDEELCQLLGEEPHPKFYVRGWFDVVGFQFAMGYITKEAQVEAWTEFSKPEEKENEVIAFLKVYGPIIDYILEKYTPDCWYQVGK